MGGARPKTTVEADQTLWLAKFPAPSDTWNQPRVEHGLLLLTRRCGLQVADSHLTRVGDADVPLVKRFDRDWSEAGYRRHRMVSTVTLLQAEDSATDRHADLQHRGQQLGGHPARSLGEPRRLPAAQQRLPLPRAAAGSGGGGVMAAPLLAPGHGHPQLDQSMKSRFNPAQVVSGIGRDSARSRKVLVPAERVGAVVAISFPSWSGPLDLQPCRHLSFSRRALPTRPPAALAGGKVRILLA